MELVMYEIHQICKQNLFPNLQLKTWRATMKEADNNKDGKLTYLEFKGAIKLAEKKMAEA